jgi:hypothetical protein
VSGSKKRQPKRSFSIRQFLPSICIGRKKDIGWPIPARRNPHSKISRNNSGPNTAATRRKNQRRPADMGALGVLAGVGGGEDRLERDRGICGAASLDSLPGSRLHCPLIIMENAGSGKKIAPAVSPPKEKGAGKIRPPRIIQLIEQAMVLLDRMLRLQLRSPAE